MFNTASRTAAQIRARRFTMVELLAVITVVGVLGAVVATVLSKRNALLETETTLLQGNLRYAQTRAMTDTGATWSVQLTATGYTLLVNGSAATVNWPGGNSSTHAFPSGVQIVAGTGTIAYDSWGNPGSSDLSITLSQDGESNQLTVVGVTGYVKQIN